MMATIYMSFDGDPDEYPYGTYAFNTHAEMNRVNELAIKIRDERDCDIRIGTVEGNI